MTNVSSTPKRREWDEFLEGPKCDRCIRFNLPCSRPMTANDTEDVPTISTAWQYIQPSNMIHSGVVANNNFNPPYQGMQSFATLDSNSQAAGTSSFDMNNSSNHQSTDMPTLDTRSLNDHPTSSSSFVVNNTADQQYYSMPSRDTLSLNGSPATTLYSPFTDGLAYNVQPAPRDIVSEIGAQLKNMISTLEYFVSGSIASEGNPVGAGTVGPRELTLVQMSLQQASELQHLSSKTAFLLGCASVEMLRRLELTSLPYGQDSWDWTAFSADLAGMVMN